MKRLLVVLALTSGSAQSLAAQLHDHTYGGLVGLSFSKAGGADVGGDSKWVTGTAVGGFLTLGVSRGIALEPQILMVEKGIKSEENGLSATAKLTYIQIPVLLKLRFHDELPAQRIAAILKLPSPFHVYRRLKIVCAELRRCLLSSGVDDSAP